MIKLYPTFINRASAQKRKTMAWPARFSLLNEKLDDFLFASVGEEESGMPLSVASALARLGMDPWTEAGRLAQLPRAEGTAALASMIARIALPKLKASDAPRVAAGLISLLPASAARISIPRAMPSRRSSKWPSWLAWLLCLALIAAAAYGALRDQSPPLGAPASIGTTLGP
jgi:hypothetical protein